MKYKISAYARLHKVTYRTVWNWVKAGKVDYLKTSTGSILIVEDESKFVSIPHAKFIQMIEYKAKLIGIDVLLTEESYTSKCSFIDNESIKKHEVYLGKRIKRGLFKSADGIKINADINASLNIARKVIPNFNTKNIEKGVQAVVVSPLRFNPYKLVS